MDFQSLKKDFPILRNQPGLVYLDSTATSLKPDFMIEKLAEYYRNYSANIYRGVYKISEKATSEFEESRKAAAKFINSAKAEEVVFTRNTTESLNLIAYSLGRKIISEGDEIVTSVAEHHSNFVTWQQLALENGAVLKIIDVDQEGYLDLGAGNIKNQNLNNLEKIITRKTKILTLTYVSNVLGTINPVREIIRAAKQINPKLITVIDAAQAAPHMRVDVRDLNCDFLAFSSHKMLGPTGVGILWGRYELLEQMYPFNYGGEMIEEVYLDKTVFKQPPLKFEAGTPDIAGVIAFKEAIYYLEKIGLEKIRNHEKFIVGYALKTLKSIFGSRIRILGPTEIEDRGGIIAFTLGNYHAHDIAAIADEENICIRAGHHCAMPLHTRYGLNSTARASFYIYNTTGDVDRLVHGLKKVEHVFK